MSAVAPDRKPSADAGAGAAIGVTTTTPAAVTPAASTTAADPASAPATHRLFLALWPSPAQRQALWQAVHTTVERGGGRPVPARNYHLTLAFLGAVPEARLGDLRAAATAVAARNHRPGGPFLHCILDGIEWWRRPRVLVATASGAATAAEALARELQSSLAAAGFRPDPKPFRPHVTLARKVSRATIGAATLSVPLSFDGFVLVDSTTEPGGSVYSVIASWALCDD